MTSNRNDSQARLLPHALRDAEREKQINAIRVQARKEFKDRIRAATSRAEKRAIKSECEAEIAKRIEPLLQERQLDTPECL